MTWILGIDEAGYGPNLGPFVMSAVACRLSEDIGDLWQHLGAIVRRASDPKDDRLVVDDSKEVYASGKGLTGLERGLRVLLSTMPETLDHLTRDLAIVDHPEMCEEVWYKGTMPLPHSCDINDLDTLQSRFASVCEEQSVSDWRVRSFVVCPRRFNALIDKHDSKSAVLGEGFIQLLEWALEETGDEALEVHVDKQGGRNTYAAQVQQALGMGLAVPLEESNAKSVYRVMGLPRTVRVTFQPRADASYMCVALASMVSKYLRELFMVEFNAFWQQHLPDLKPTAGYPSDARRYLVALRPLLKTLKIDEEGIWRKR